MAGLTYTRKAPCIGGYIPIDPTTCLPYTDAFLYKFRGDTPITVEAELRDDQDWTETATDGTTCGAPAVKRGLPSRYNLTVTRCQISADMEAALRGSNGRILTSGGDTVGSAENYDPTASACNTVPLPAGLMFAVTPIAECGTSGYCETGGANCLLDLWPFVMEPQIVARSLQGVSDPASFSVWAYPTPADVLANLPANIVSLFPGGVQTGDVHLDVRVDCNLVPGSSCDVVPVADLFVP